MSPLPDNLPWHALNTVHARFAIGTVAARRYPADVTPFAGTAGNGRESMTQLAGLLSPGETTWVMGATPAKVQGLTYGAVFPCLQMGGPPVSKPVPGDAGDNRGIAPLTCSDAGAMVALTDLAFPGFFRFRTCEMGTYFGFFEGNELIAMAGERLAIPGWREISGICTHPRHTGKGLAARLIRHLLREHARASLSSFLLVSCANARAIELYYRLGFTLLNEVTLHPVTRSPL